MHHKFLAASLALTLAAAPAFAQTQLQNPACNVTKSTAAQSSPNAPSNTTSMADTSSDSGNLGSGASSAAIGTGNTDKTGVNSPCVPAITGHGTTGALPTNKAQ